MITKKLLKNIKKVSKVVAKEKAAKKTVKKTAKKATSKAQKKTHVAIIVDQSGSMESIKAETISSINAQIKTIKKEAKKSNTSITLTLFSDKVEILKFANPLADQKELADKDYTPGGFTAMYDAIGMTVERMKKEIDDINDTETAVLVIIITDGQENASKTWSALDIAAVVKGLTATKRWTFTVLGANIDLAGLSETLGFAKSNIAKFTSNSRGVMRATNVTTSSVGNYFTTRNQTDDLAGSNISAQFYSPTEEITDTSDDSDKK